MRLLSANSPDTQKKVISKPKTGKRKNIFALSILCSLTSFLLVAVNLLPAPPETVNHPKLQKSPSTPPILFPEQTPQQNLLEQHVPGTPARSLTVEASLAGPIIPENAVSIVIDWPR